MKSRHDFRVFFTYESSELTAFSKVPIDRLPIADRLHVSLHTPRLSGLVKRGLIFNPRVRGEMADIQMSAEELRPLVQEVVRVVIDELAGMQHLINGKLALAEEDAAELLDLNPWQLRDLRLAGEIGFSRIVGRKVRYSLTDLDDYLRRHRQRGKQGR